MNLKVMKALEYIHSNGLSNVEWSIEMDICQSKAMYGTYFDITLPPHVAIWVAAQDLPNDLVNSSPDYFLITADGKQALFIWSFTN